MTTGPVARRGYSYLPDLAYFVVSIGGGFLMSLLLRSQVRELLPGAGWDLLTHLLSVAVGIVSIWHGPRIVRTVKENRKPDGSHERI